VLVWPLGPTMSNGNTISGTGGSPGPNTSNALSRGTTGSKMGTPAHDSPSSAASHSNTVNTHAANRAMQSVGSPPREFSRSSTTILVVIRCCEIHPRRRAQGRLATALISSEQPYFVRGTGADTDRNSEVPLDSFLMNSEGLNAEPYCSFGVRWHRTLAEDARNLCRRFVKRELGVHDETGRFRSQTKHIGI
jgi:hypothetical protein